VPHRLQGGVTGGQRNIERKVNINYAYPFARSTTDNHLYRTGKKIPEQMKILNSKNVYSTLFIIALLSYLALSKIFHLNILDSIVFAIISASIIYIALIFLSIYLSLITNGFKNRAARIQEKQALEKLLEIAHKSGDKELIREQEQLAKEFLAIIDKPENKYKRKKRPFHGTTIYLITPGFIYAAYTQDFIINPTIAESLSAIIVLLTSYIVIRVISKKETIIASKTAGKKPQDREKSLRPCSLFFHLLLGFG